MMSVKLAGSEVDQFHSMSGLGFTSGAQLVLTDGTLLISTHNAFWLDTLIFPAYVAIFSALVLLLHGILLSRPARNLYHHVFSVNGAQKTDYTTEECYSAHPIGFFAEIKEHVSSHGGPVIFAHMAVRLVGCLALLGLSLATFILVEGQTTESDNGVSGMRNKHKHKHWRSSSLSEAEWLQVAMCMSSAYATLLALVSVTARPSWSRLVTKHLVSVLLVTFSVYAYRDLWPLATYTLSPKDQNEGWILWAKVTVTTLTAIVIPLTIPRQYVPFDPKDPALEANPEQTASLGAILIYTFLDPIIFLAYRVPHLHHDQLPPLADYDYAKNLVKNAFPHLDPFTNKKPRRRHLVFSLLRVFQREYIIMAIMVIIEVACGFARPLGINRLLNYLQERGQNVVVRPWMWIVVLLAGTLISNGAFQYYIFIATRSLVRTEAIITQLVFEHSLRIRMKVEIPGSAAVSGATTPALGNDSNTDGISETQESPNGNGSSLPLQSNTTSISSASSKGKQKAKEAKISEHLVNSKKEETKSDNLIGKINNLVTTDLGNITEARDVLLLILHVPLQIALGIWFLYVILGWSAFVGFGVMLLMFPIPGYIAGRIQHVQMARMKKTDARVQTVTETMNVLRMIKLFGWESKMTKRLSDKRDEELFWLWKRKLLELITNNVNYLIPVLIMLVTYAVYTLIMKQELSASKVFSSMAVFDMLLDQLHMIAFYLQMVIQAKVSLDRVDDFLKNTELLDAFDNANQTPEHDELIDGMPVDRNVIGFHNAKFSWSNENTGTLTPSRRNFTLKIKDELFFKHGCINLVVGPTGSGKTSLLMALLGEMHFIPSGPDSWFNLPREGGVAYAAQESWVQNETIRENIIFGAPFDETRYNQVIYQCGLERDLALFEAGDRTEVGEKGLTLSGGQKARVTLARAVYSSANVLLLDDVLAALDVHTAKWIVEKCFRGDLIRGKTVILVTHNVAIASPVAGFVVSLGLDGSVLSQGGVSDALAKDHTLIAEVTKDEELIEKAENEIDSAKPDSEKKQSDGKLTVKEEIMEGHVSWTALKLYFLNLSGHPHLFWFVFLGGNFLSEFVPVVQTWYLGFWASQYDTHPASEVAAYSYLTVYTLLLVVAVIIYNVTQFMFYWGSVRASKMIHEKLIESVLGTTLRWLDTTPTSRVITRCTQDVRAVDGPIPWGLSLWLQFSTSMITKFAAVMLFTPIFLVPGLSVALVGFWCGQIYMKAQLSVKREMSNAKAPVLGHFGAAIAGLTSIRAYGAQQAFRKESLARIDRYTRSATTFYNLNRWVSIRIDTLGELFAAGLAAYLIYGQRILPIASDAGFSLNMAIGFSSVLLWCVRLFNDFEVNGNSLERIQAYVAIDQEPKDTDAGEPPAYWPASGDVKVENLSAKYSSGGPKVLHDISFHIKPGERVGVVGRTGSGKSSLTLSLLRCILTEGTVYYDGLPTNSLNLSALRSSITIIPQIPELLSGTLRQNLDPFDQYEDATLNDALRAAGLYSLQSEDDEGRITLDSAISSGGDNVSVGQRQILALARAILRGSKLLILDEATSAIDYKTDEVIQSSLRHQLGNDTSLITVAHRLHTIMDADKIMVLDAGRIAEFDSPTELLKNEKGMLRALVDHSGDKETLYAIAERKASASKATNH